MATLDSLIKVLVTVSQPVTEGQGFGTLMILTDGTVSFAANEIRSYVNAEQVNADAADLGPQATIEALAAFNLDVPPSRIKVANYNPANAIDAELNVIELSDPDWYGLCITGTKGFTKADQLLAAAWVKPLRKLYAIQTSDADVINGVAGNILLALEALDNDRCCVIYHATNTEPEAITALASLLAVDPGVGATIMAHKTHPGITPQDAITQAQLDNLLADGNNGNIYGVLGGEGNFQRGIAANGIFLDVRLIADWLEARITEGIIAALKSFSDRGSKIPYTDAGFGVLENVARRVLRQAVISGQILRDSESFVVPLAAKAAPADRAARRFRLSFGAQITGAIQEADWAGVIEV